VLKDLKTSGLKDFQVLEGNAQNHIVQSINLDNPDAIRRKWEWEEQLSFSPTP
jgi:hypothetical protein